MPQNADDRAIHENVVIDTLIPDLAFGYAINSKKRQSDRLQMRIMG